MIFIHIEINIFMKEGINMKKSTVIQVIIIIALAIILGVLLKFTIDASNENNSPQIANQGMGEQNGSIPGQNN
jgi:preprotein translocase subunit SecG